MCVHMHKAYYCTNNATVASSVNEREGESASSTFSFQKLVSKWQNEGRCHLLHCALLWFTFNNRNRCAITSESRTGVTCCIVQIQSGVTCCIMQYNDSLLMTGQVLPVASCNTVTHLWWQGRCYLLHCAIPRLTFDDRVGVQYHESPLMTGQVCNTITHLWWQDRCRQLDPAVVQGPGQHGHAPWLPCHAVAQACSGTPARTVHLQWWPHLPGCLATWWPVDILGIALHDLWHCDAATFNYYCQLFFLQNA